MRNLFFLLLFLFLNRKSNKKKPNQQFNLLSNEHKQGAHEAGLMASVWLPLNYPEPVDLSDQSIYPDITISNIYELKSLLIVDDAPTQPNTQGPSTSGNSRSLKLKASRSNVMSNGASTSSSTLSGCIGTGCFSSSKGKVNATSNAPYPKRFLPPPDLENNNSNASDGSWLRSTMNIFEILAKNIRFVLLEGIL